MTDQQDDADTTPEPQAPQAPPPLSGFQMQPPAPPLGQALSPYAQPPGYPERKPKWPIVIGVLSIVFGSLGLLCTPINMLQMQVGETAQTSRMIFPEWYLRVTLVESLFGLVLAGVLLTAGILAVRRKPACRGFHLAYAVLTLVQLVIGGILYYRMVGEVDLSGLKQPVQSAARMGLRIGGAAMILGAIYPVFLLIWFSRTKIRDQVRQWAGQRPEENIYQYPQGNP